MIIQEQGPATKASQQAKSGTERAYGLALRSAARGLLKGVYDETQFAGLMVDIVEGGLSRAFRQGLKQAGVPPGDLLTPAFLPERLALDAIIAQNLGSIFSFSGYILQRKEKFYDQGKKQLAITQVFNRALLWTNQYDKARVTAFTMASGDEKRIWIYGDTIEHCDSCSVFVDRVYRASTWAKHNAIPKSSRLCCTGRQCGCDLIPTDLPITRGRFPAGALCN